MTKANFRTKFEARVIELMTTRRLTQRQAERVAKRERRLASPLHTRAVARRWAMAQDRRAALSASVEVVA